MNDRFPIGVILWPSRGWATLRGQWRLVEDMGASAGWLYDHVSWRGITPWYDAFTLLAAAAEATSRLPFGTLVTTPNTRHPLATAHAARTLQQIGGGRMTLGVGAGSATSDTGVTGPAPATAGERHERFAQWLDAVSELLRGAALTGSGATWSMVDAAVPAGPDPAPVPLAVAAGGPRGIRLAARYGDAWVTVGDPGNPAEPSVRRQIALLERACLAAGRDPATIRRILVTGTGPERWQRSAAEFAALADRYRDLGITEFALHWPVPHGPYPADRAVLEEIVTSYAA